MVRSRPTVVHAHDVNTLVTAWVAATLSGARLVYDAHEISTDREGYRSIRSLVASVERILMPRAYATITTTDMRAKFFARAYSVPRPLVLQNRPRRSPASKGERLRDELGLTRDWPIVLYQGGLQAGRGLEDLVEAATEVQNAYFVFLGGGRIENKLRERAKALGLEGRVRFLPTVPLEDLPSYTVSADVGVQPIRNTCLNHLSTDSNKLFEYAMAGLPVAASDFPEIRKIVRAHGLGELFDPEQPGALVATLRRLVDNPELRARYAANAKASAACLSWQNQESKLLDLYDRLLESAVDE
jgi:glycosyltransferase involved in cell wall biosynthesis